MNIALASDHLLKGSTPQSALAPFRFHSSPGAAASGLDDPVSLPDAELASLRRALESEFGPELSCIRVYVGPKAGGMGTNPITDHRFYFRELRFKQT